MIGRYPYKTPRERECVELIIVNDFNFLSSFVQFSQVIDNLMKNAFRALQATDRTLQRGDLRIEVSCRNDQGLIVVADKGRGIKPELIDRIFEPFFSTNRGTGHGLGLAFCAQVIKSANGAISVKSFWNTGTQFSLELPVMRDAPLNGFLKNRHVQT